MEAGRCNLREAGREELREAGRGELREEGRGELREEGREEACHLISRKCCEIRKARRLCLSILTSLWRSQK